MSLDEDVAAARRAVDALEQACAPLTRHFGDTVDARRLRLDVARLRDDLNLLCAGPARGSGLYEDRRSTAASWGDGMDADFGAPGRATP